MLDGDTFEGNIPHYWTVPKYNNTHDPIRETGKTSHPAVELEKEPTLLDLNVNVNLTFTFTRDGFATPR